MTYHGEPISGIPFFELLYADNKFCQEIGRCSLVCSRLEVALINFLVKNHIQPKKNASLGRLIKQANENNLLSKNELAVLEDISDQRNHMIHRLYSLFTGLSEETRLPRSNLIDSDVWTYIGYASQLKENLHGIGDIFMKKQHTSTAG